MLLHQTEAETGKKGQMPLDDYLLLSVHALESGDTQLSKSSLWGSRNYFSGGAVATYTIFNHDGTLLCGGVSYGYRGFIEAKDMSFAILALKQVPLPDTNAVSMPCVVNK